MPRRRTRSGLARKKKIGSPKNSAVCGANNSSIQTAYLIAISSDLCVNTHISRDRGTKHLAVVENEPHARHGYFVTTPTMTDIDVSNDWELRYIQEHAKYDVNH